MANRSIVIKVIEGHEGDLLGPKKTGLFEIAHYTSEPGIHALWHITLPDAEIDTLKAGVELVLASLTAGEAF